MSVEDCRKAQRECAAAVNRHIEEIRIEVKDDIAAIRAAVQEIDRNVSRIKGFLGINGEPREPMRHKRDSEEEEHLHRRITDLVTSVEGLREAKSEGTVTLPKWFVWLSIGIMGVMLYLAAFAGPHGVEHAVTLMPKP